MARHVVQLARHSGARHSVVRLVKMRYNYTTAKSWGLCVQKMRRFQSILGFLLLQLLALAGGVPQEASRNSVTGYYVVISKVHLDKGRLLLNLSDEVVSEASNRVQLRFLPTDNVREAYIIKSD